MSTLLEYEVVVGADGVARDDEGNVWRAGYAWMPGTYAGAEARRCAQEAQPKKPQREPLWKRREVRGGSRVRREGVERLLARLEERMARLGNPDLRAAAAVDFARRVRDFAGDLAMRTGAPGEPEAEIAANDPRVRAAVKAALGALGKLGRAILDAERSIDISPRVAGALAAEAAEGGHLNKYDPGSLLGAVVALLEREGLDDAATAVRDVSRQVSRAWAARER